MHAEHGLSGREFRAELLARLRSAAAAGTLGAGLVRDAAAACDVSERTMWRWVRDGLPRSRGRAGWKLSERAWELYVQWHGNVAAVHRDLLAEGAIVPSRRTLQRAFARELLPGEDEYIRSGVRAARDRVVYLRHEPRFRGACYEADHKLLSIEVLALRAQRPSRPWATVFIDQFSRLIVGWVLSLRPTQAEVLAALRMAVIEDDRRAFGGVPVALRWDGGLEFAARSIADAALAMGCVTRPTASYSPWEKGKIERLNRTIEQELLRGLPGEGVTLSV